MNGMILLSVLCVLGTVLAANNNCDKDMEVGDFVFRVPSPNVPSYQYYVNGSSVKYLVQLSDLVFNSTGSVGNLNSWDWAWDCGIDFCPTADACSFTYYGSSKGSPSLNITMVNNVSADGIKFSVTLSGKDAPSLLASNNELDFVFGFKCTQGSCSKPILATSASQTAALTSYSSIDFSLFSVLTNTIYLSNSSDTICSINAAFGMTSVRRDCRIIFFHMFWC
jgi:hypothetical protein